MVLLFYDRLTVLKECETLEMTELRVPGVTELPGWRITCTEATSLVNTEDTFTVIPQGEVTFRSRQSGDRIRLSGGSKSLKKLFIDRKIPAWERSRIPVLTNGSDVVAVMGIGTDCRFREAPNWEIVFQKVFPSAEAEMIKKSGRN